MDVLKRKGSLDKMTTLGRPSLKWMIRQYKTILVIISKYDVIIYIDNKADLV